jgi:quercetin dioxygenase-like cupin family protein
MRSSPNLALVLSLVLERYGGENMSPYLPEQSSGSASAEGWEPLQAIGGLPLIGGEGMVRVRTRSTHGILLEVVYPAGVSTPMHQHDHDSHLYLLSGHLAGTLDGRAIELLPGETLLHLAGVAHSVAALADSRWLEFKAPPGTPWTESRTQ